MSNTNTIKNTKFYPGCEEPYPDLTNHFRHEEA